MKKSVLRVMAMIMAMALMLAMFASCGKDVEQGPAGPVGPQGTQGETGIGIESIAKTSTEGLVDTYTITFTDGTATIFTVTNGGGGEQGIQGIQGVKGEDGHTPVITIQNGYWYIDGVNTNQSAIGISGATGNGISSIAKTNTEGLIDTYTITFTNGDTSTFTVTNGAAGAQGEQGIQGIQGERGEDGHTPVITIQNGKWYIDGVDTGVLVEGLKGDTGNGISSIEKTKTEGLIDTYTITFTNGDISTFTVTNGAAGAQGEQGIQGIQGEKGDDGHTPVITIQNGKWYIDGVDSGKSAEGVKGDTGNGISSIAKTNTEGLVDTYTITFTNGETTTFTVTNGAPGEQGQQGIQGAPGKDGHTPVITIQNGKWYIDGVDSGVSAEGLKGDDGLSAFEIYQKYHPEYTGTEEEWIESLKGEQGNSVVNTHVDEYYHLWTEFSNGDKVDAGYVGPGYTVTFKDFDGSVILTITNVEYKKGATAPVEPSRTGYVFVGWDKDFSSVTENITITAEYEIEEVAEHNQLFFSFKDNGDGTTTATLIIRGEVNLYGLEMKLTIDSVGMEFDSVASSVPGLLANYNGEYILVSFVTTSGTDLTTQTELLTIVFNNIEDVRTAEITVSDVDIFDDEYNDETFSVSGNAYEK